MPCGQWNAVGVEEVIFNPRGVEEPAEVSGEESLALWPMMKPDGHFAGVKRVELHPSGSWCNDIRNVEISVHVSFRLVLYMKSMSNIEYVILLLCLVEE